MVIARTSVHPEDCWDINTLFSNQEAWEKAFQQVPAATKTGQPRWLKIHAYKNRLGESAEILKKAIIEIMLVERELEKLYTYAHLRHDEDIVHDQHKNANARITNLLHELNQEISWFEPELLSLSEVTISNYLKSPILSEYHFYLEKIVRMKEHTLSAEKEELLALAAPALQTSQKAFSALNDADFKFGMVADSSGEEHEITHARYSLYLRSQDRVLRKNAYCQYHGHYGEYENTLCELISGIVQRHRFNARARNYNSCLDAALFPNNIDTAVYHALIGAVHDNIAPLHKYTSLRKRVLKLESLHLYDMNVPLTKDVEKKVPYLEAEELIIDSVAPLGATYQDLLRNGLKQQRWVDRYENQNKRSGAYSSGCYDSYPYILMNYKDLLRDVFTLAHEAGHSMHSLLSRTHQPYQYSHYPIFVAEVASTFNEELLTQLLLERAKNKEEKIYLINQKIEDIRGTLFRQTMFAEFELLIHSLIEKDIPLTPKLLKEEYRKLNRFYFGNELVIDLESDAEWSRIPHFYYNFYVFQYATGISAALALVQRVKEGKTSEREDYLSFLKSGSSKYPIDALKLAGVDMRSSQPVNAAINQFSGLVDQLEELLTS